MNHRERVAAAMGHEEPDRVPLFYRDIPEVENRLLRELGLRDREELLRHFDIDFRWVEPPYVGPPLEIDGGRRIRDVWGVEYKYEIVGDGGYWEVASSPFADTSDPAALDDHQWPSVEWFDYSALPSQIEAHEEYMIMTAPGYASPPGPLSVMQAMCGMEKCMTDMLLCPEFCHAFVERVVDFQLGFLERMFTASGDRIDFYRVGDDYGTQRGLLMSPGQWREFIQPGLKKMADLAKRHGAFYYHHTCGAIRQLIPELIETGVDVLDPIQVAAAGMVPSELKAEFGDRLCFSGGVDEQELLPRGNPEDVRKGVNSLLNDMARGGGFFLGPTHNLQMDIPTRNIVAMYEAGREWRY